MDTVPNIVIIERDGVKQGVGPRLHYCYSFQGEVIGRLSHGRIYKGVRYDIYQKVYNREHIQKLYVTERQRAAWSWMGSMELVGSPEVFAILASKQPEGIDPTPCRGFDDINPLHPMIGSDIHYMRRNVTATLRVEEGCKVPSYNPDRDIQIFCTICKVWCNIDKCPSAPGQYVDLLAPVEEAVKKIPYLRGALGDSYSSWRIAGTGSILRNLTPETPKLALSILAIGACARTLRTKLRCPDCESVISAHTDNQDV